VVVARRLFLFVAFAGVLLAGVPVAAENDSAREYDIDLDPTVTKSDSHQGKKGLWVTLNFRVRRASDGALATDVSKDEIVIREDGEPVTDLEIVQQQQTLDLSTVLVLDVSGSMASSGKMEAARKAAGQFLDKLHARCDTGLILFDHEIPENDPTRFRRPSGNPARYEAHRKEIRALIAQAKPLGGTAYLDATARAIEMLKDVKGRKAVLLMTDGVDMNSKAPLDGVIKVAKAEKVPVYTIGIGEPGSKESVTTVLVLDQSGSMSTKANDKDKKTKMEALKQAAARFVELMRPNAKTTLLPFSSEVSTPAAFTSNKKSLKDRIVYLGPGGGTLLYDATMVGIETLVAANLQGKKAVLVLTDGKDEQPGSRYSDKEVIKRAKEAGIPLYMLGLGRSQEIAGATMAEMADKTGGKFHHIQDEASLIRIFEQLSIDIHDDGIDEASLRQLAEETGGKYFPVRDVSQLHLSFAKLATALQSDYEVTFRSHRQSHDGTTRGISITIERGGKQKSDEVKLEYNVHGVVVVPDMKPATYVLLLVLLGALGGLLALPAALRQRSPEARG
jgi:VWFA-related protein